MRLFVRAAPRAASCSAAAPDSLPILGKECAIAAAALHVRMPKRKADKAQDVGPLLGCQSGHGWRECPQAFADPGGVRRDIGRSPCQQPWRMFAGRSKAFCRLRTARLVLPNLRENIGEPRPARGVSWFIALCHWYPLRSDSWLLVENGRYCMTGPMPIGGALIVASSALVSFWHK